jgi:minor capsid protein
MKLEYLAQVLQDAGLGTIGTDIFVDYMPAEVTKGVVLKNPLAGTPVDPNLPDYYRTRLQAIVRAPTRDVGNELSDRVGKALKMFNRKFYDLNGKLAMQINHIYPAQLPIVYPYTPGNVIEWSLNFVTSYVQPSN